MTHATEIVDFRYQVELRGIALMTAQEEIALAIKIKAGDQAARQAFVERNLRLVPRIAGRFQGCGMDMDDLIQEGNIGLMKAVERWDHTKGFKFSTYAVWWIMQSIQRNLNLKGKQIRLPENLARKAQGIKRATEKLTNSDGREPTYEEIAEAAGVSMTDVKKLYPLVQTPLYMDAFRKQDFEDTVDLKSYIPDDQAVDPEESAEAAALREQLERLMKELTPREEEILKLRMGWNGADPKSLAEVGTIYKLSRERIRQIEVKALNRLRSPRRARTVKDFY